MKTFLISILASILFLIYSCKKDNNCPTNPYNGKTTAVFNSTKSYGSLTDIDGNIYKTITIGTQTWMAENLRTIHYRNGDQIPNITESSAWTASFTGAYRTLNNSTSVDTIATYGQFYNGYAILDSRNIAPTGWHVPTDAEWITLITFLGGENVSGGLLKETSTTHWSSTNVGATNESGFTALPGSYLLSDGTFYGTGGKLGGWWSSTQMIGPSYIHIVDLGYWSNSIQNDGEIGLNAGESVRCVKD